MLCTEHGFSAQTKESELSYDHCWCYHGALYGQLSIRNIGQYPALTIFVIFSSELQKKNSKIRDF